MEKEKINEVLSIVLGVFSVIAIGGILIQNKFTMDTIFNAIVNFTQVAVPVLAILVISIRMRKINETYLKIGRSALEKLQKKHSDILIGPKYNRENYDPEKGKGKEYLFIADDTPKSKQRAKFITIPPLEEGVLSIYVQKGTLVYGLKYKSEEAIDSEIKVIQAAVKESVIDKLEKKYKDCYELIENTPANTPDAAIIIDFDEKKMTGKKYYDAIYQCAEQAIEVIKKYKK
jgi:hypothetical protein